MNPTNMTISLMQHRSVMTTSARKRGLLAIIHPIILLRERGRNFHYDIGRDHLMTSGWWILTHPKNWLITNQEFVWILLVCSSRTNQMKLYYIWFWLIFLKRWDKRKTWLHPTSIAMNPSSYISLEDYSNILK